MGYMDGKECLKVRITRRSVAGFPISGKFQQYSNPVGSFPQSDMGSQVSETGLVSLFLLFLGVRNPWKLTSLFTDATNAPELR